MIGVFESKSTKHSFLEEMHFSETFARRGECKLSSKLRSVVVVAAGRRQLGKPASPAKTTIERFYLEEMDVNQHMIGFIGSKSTNHRVY